MNALIIIAIVAASCVAYAVIAGAVFVLAERTPMERDAGMVAFMWPVMLPIVGMVIVAGAVARRLDR